MASGDHGIHDRNLTVEHRLTRLETWLKVLLALSLASWSTNLIAMGLVLVRHGA